MRYTTVEDDALIERYLKVHAGLHVYGLGDLEPDLRAHTRYYAAFDGGAVQAMCVLFEKYDPPCLLAISEPENQAIKGLLAATSDDLPGYAEIHLSPAGEGALDDTCEFIDMVGHWKMALAEPRPLDGASKAGRDIDRLGPDDVGALGDLYDSVYGHASKRNVFHPSMLDVGPYFGVRDGRRLISVAGVHVYSPRYGVAAVANVATHPDHRGRGLARAVTARLCLELGLHVRHIGLNVVDSNVPAIRAYEAIGFRVIGSYQEGYIRRKPTPRTP